MCKLHFIWISPAYILSLLLSLLLSRYLALIQVQFILFSSSQSVTLATQVSGTCDTLIARGRYVFVRNDTNTAIVDLSNVIAH